MSDQSDVIVKIDDRVRLMSAVLAATEYPTQAQKAKPHGTHAHARATRKFLKELSKQNAVEATQKLIDQGTPLDALFALVMLMDWPNLTIPALPPWAPHDYNAMLRDFYEIGELGEWWEKEKAVWDKTLHEAANVFQKAQFKEFFIPFLDKVDEQLIFMPNVSYPTDYDVGFHIRNDVVCIAPPPLAWGDSPPWPYDERTMHAYSIRAAMYAFGRMLLDKYFKVHSKELDDVVKSTELPVGDQFKAQYPAWKGQFEALFLSAIVAMYLEAHIDEKEYKAYMLMQKKARGMDMLPGTVSVLRRYLQEVGKRKYNNLAEFLPFFPVQLRVAKKIVTF